MRLMYEMALYSRLIQNIYLFQLAALIAVSPESLIASSRAKIFGVSTQSTRVLGCVLELDNRRYIETPRIV